MDRSILTPIIKKMSYFVIPIILLVVGLLAYLNRPGTVIIEAETGVDISIATTKGGDFKKIGTSQVKYKTRDVPASVYILGSKDDQKTISTARVERGKTTLIDIKLSKLVKATPVFNGSLLNTFISGTTVQGVLPDEYTLTSFKTDTHEVGRVEFISLPYVRKVVWSDVNNFVYAKFKGGVGRFAGSDQGGSMIATSISGKDLESILPGSNGQGIEIIDIAKSKGKPLVLVSEANLFLSNNMGASVSSIAGFEASTGVTRLFADETYIYRAVSGEPSVYADEGEESKGEEHSNATTLYQYDYSGKEIGKYELDDSSVVNATSKGGLSYILTPNKIINIDQGKLVSNDLYFRFTGDLTTYNGEVVLLGDDGIWKLSKDGVSAQLIYAFRTNGVGQKNSFSVSDGRLIFGTRVLPEDRANNAKTFSISF